MNFKLQIILIISSILFFIFIFKMTKNFKLELRYSLTWILFSLILTLISIFPGILTKISTMLNIKEPVNTIFLLVIFFLLIITFSLTLSLSKKYVTIKDLVQEIGLLNLKLDKLKDTIDKNHSSI